MVNNIVIGKKAKKLPTPVWVIVVLRWLKRVLLAISAGDIANGAPFLMAHQEIALIAMLTYWLLDEAAPYIGLNNPPEQVAP